MSECTDEVLKFQISLAKRVMTETHGMSKDLQLKVYDNICTDLRQRRIENERNKNKNDKPTEKQIKFAESLGIENPEKYTKAELSKEIDKKTN